MRHVSLWFKLVLIGLEQARHVDPIGVERLGLLELILGLGVKDLEPIRNLIYRATSSSVSAIKNGFVVGKTLSHFRPR